MARARLVHKFNNSDDDQNLSSISSNIYKQTEREQKKRRGNVESQEMSWHLIFLGWPKWTQRAAKLSCSDCFSNATYKCKTIINRRLQNSCWMAKKNHDGRGHNTSQHWKGSLRVFVNVQRKCFGNLWVALRSKTLHGGDLTASLFKLSSFIGMFFLSSCIWAWITVNYCRIKHFVAVV